MAVDYSIPPWIGGGGAALGAVEAGANLGARIAEANQRAALSFADLQAQQQRFAVEQQYRERAFEVETRLKEQQLLRDDQQLQMENARKDAELGLKRQAFELDSKIQASKFAAQNQFLKETQAFEKAQLAQGVDPETARRNALQAGVAKYGPMMGFPAGAYSSLFKGPAAAKPPQTIKLPNGDVIQRTPEGGFAKVWQGVPKPAKEPMVKAQITPAGEVMGEEISGIPLSQYEAMQKARQEQVPGGKPSAGFKILSVKPVAAPPPQAAGPMSPMGLLFNRPPIAGPTAAEPADENQD